MKIYPVRNVSLPFQKSNHSLKVQQPIQPVFKGWKGAGAGAGAGALWAGAVLTMTAIGAPYLLPFIATEVAIGGIGNGALAGHCIENELKDDKKK